MEVLQRIVTGPSPCLYLSGRAWRQEYLYVPRLTPEEYEALMDEGYRKFGALAFRPVCRACSECRPIRIDVERFAPDRSQRRAQKRNEHLEVRWARPTVDEERLELLRRYQAAQSERKGWPESEKDAVEYEFSFVDNPLPAVEISMWEGDRLRAVALTESTPNVLSGVYHYYDPDLYIQGVGTHCMLQTLELARRQGKRWAYFGYYVEGCGSLTYKARFKPCELLGVDGVWRDFDCTNPSDALTSLDQ